MNNVLLKKGQGGSYQTLPPPLEYEEIVRLFQEKEKMEERSECEKLRTIKKELVVRNIRLVFSIARSIALFYSLGNMTIEDLRHEGIIGLMNAIDRFDWRRGYRFSTVASWWIKQAIIRGIFNQSSVIRIPCNMREKIISFNRARVRLAFSSRSLPKDKEIAEAMGLKETAVKNIKKAKKNIVSLNAAAPSHDEENERGRKELLEYLYPKNYPTVSSIIENKESEAEIDQALSFLEPREKFIIKGRYGFLDNGNIMTLQAIGKKLGLTRERVRQLQENSLKKIRRIFKAKGIRSPFENGRYS